MPARGEFKRPQPIRFAAGDGRLSVKPVWFTTDSQCMGLTFLTGYVLGQHGAQSARVASQAARRSSAYGQGELFDVNDRIDRLLLAVDAMWSLLEDNGYTEEQLVARIEELDAADGSVDGRRRPAGRVCRGCGTKVPASRAACQFCGTEVPGKDDDPFVGI